MVFSSMTFLCVFFPVVFALYYILPGLRARNVLLILASLLFYAYGEPAYVLLMIFSIVMNYFFGRMMNTRNGGCEITLSTEKEDFSFKMNERSSFMLKLTCDENFNYKL